MIQDLILSRFQPSQAMNGSAYAGKSKLAMLPLLPDLRGKRVLDFGCGAGHEVLELAKMGAEAYGCDIRPPAPQDGVWLGRPEDVPVLMDYIISLDSFEHFGDPGGVLESMAKHLKPGGEVITSFGPTWYHPLGGHLFSVFPWAHLVFTEKALIRWRSQYRSDGATRFNEVAGGLNQLTIKRFEQIVSVSPFEVKSLECVPIRAVRRLHNRLTRELFTSVVRCRLSYSKSDSGG